MLTSVLILTVSVVSVHGIWGGYNSDIAYNAHTAAILQPGYRGWEHRCTGAILSNRIILTTAYCAGDLSGNVRVRVGSSYHHTGGLTYPVDAIYKHPEFNSDFDYDIALLHFNIPLKLSRHVAIVKLPYQNESLSEDAEIKISGWGYTTADIQQVHLKVGEPKIMNAEACNSFYFQITGKNLLTENMLCTDAKAQPCEKDQGAPLVYMGNIYGLSSWNFGCTFERSTPVYTKVSVFRAWIDTYL